MTTKSKKELQEQIRQLLLGYGFQPSTRSPGTLQKVNSDGKEIRYKFNANALRREVALDKRYYGQKQWVRISSGYWKDLSIVENKIVGMKR
jgi:hypothetical protein